MISPVIGLSCHRRLRKSFRRLDAGVEASGPHDFAVRFALFVISTSASIASRPAFVTIASRPSVGRDGGAYEVICAKRERKCFCNEGWTEKSLICPSGVFLMVEIAE